MSTDKSKSFFYGRTRELKLLDETSKVTSGKLIVIYGRRRVGKSSLINKFIEGKNALLFEALEAQHTPAQIGHFTSCLKKYFNDPLLDSVNFKDWGKALDYLTSKIKASRGKQIIVFDEFQWMAQGQSKLVALIKYYWDLHWKDQNVVLILCGSIASYMVQKVIKSKALYGRISLTMLLKALLPFEAMQIFQNKRGKEEVLKYLMLFGGIPKYLNEINLNKSFEKNINELCFSPTGYMVDEFEKIFFSQFKESQTYQKICRLMQNQALSLTDLSKKLKMPVSGGLKNYLSNLENAEFIKSFRPFQSTQKTRIIKYKLTDEYLCFYFKYILPNLSLIKEGISTNPFLTLTRKSWEIWMGYAFERFCFKNAAVLAKIMGFADEVTNVGPSFKKGDMAFQIDLLFERASSVITLVEIKHHLKPITTAVIPEVEKKIKLIKLPRGYTLEKALVSVYGPDESLKQSDYFHHHVQLNDFFSSNF